MLVRSILIALIVAAFSPVAAAQQPGKVKHWTQFATAFSDAVKNNDFPKQQNLVKVNKEFLELAWNDWEARWCGASAKGEAASTVARDTDRTLEALAFLNKTVHRSDYLVERRAWLQGLSQEAKVIKGRLWDRYNTIWEVWDNALKLPTEEKMRDVGELILPMAESAEAAGDNYWAANAYHMLARCFEAIPEYFDAYYYCKKAVTLGQQGFIARKFSRQGADLRAGKLAKSGRIREELVRIDLALAESKAAYEAALKGGVPTSTDPNAKGGSDEGGKVIDGDSVAEGPIPGPRPNDHRNVNMDWVEAEKMKVKPVSKPPKFALPLLASNAHWWFWQPVQLGDQAQGTFPFAPGGATIKNDSGKLLVDMDGDKDKRKPERIKFANKPKLVKLKKASYRDGSTGDVWIRAMLQPSQYKIVNFSFRMTGKGRVIRALGASVAQGKMRGKDIAIYDVNGNGVFGDMGTDCLVIGKGKSAKPMVLSQVIMLDGKFYELSVSPNGRKVRTRPYDGPIAALKVEFDAKMKPEWLIASGSGKDSSVYFNLMDAVDQPMWVVPSAYQIHHGFISKGKGDKAKTMRISKGRSGIFNVQPGKMNNWALGGAGKKGFTFGFKAERRREKGQPYVIIPGNEVKVYGNFGELYDFTMFGLPLPMVEIRSGKDGPVWHKGEMRKPDRSDSQKSADLIWCPKTLKVKKGSSGDYSVRLTGDVPALGKATSEWSLGN